MVEAVSDCHHCNTQARIKGLGSATAEFPRSYLQPPNSAFPVMPDTTHKDVMLCRTSMLSRSLEVKIDHSFMESWNIPYPNSAGWQQNSPRADCQAPPTATTTQYSQWRAPKDFFIWYILSGISSFFFIHIPDQYNQNAVYCRHLTCVFLSSLRAIRLGWLGCSESMCCKSSQFSEHSLLTFSGILLCVSVPRHFEPVVKPLCHADSSQWPYFLSLSHYDSRLI